MRNRILLAFFLSLAALCGCNEKPEIEPDNRRNLYVYPNPTDGRATAHVNFETETLYTLKVFDEKGNVFLEEQELASASHSKSYPLNLTGKPDGKYQIVLKSGEKVTWQTLIKVSP